MNRGKLYVKVMNNEKLYDEYSSSHNDDVEIKQRSKTACLFSKLYLVFEDSIPLQSECPVTLKYRNRNSLSRYICSKGKNPSDPVVEAPLYHLPRSGRSVLNIGKMQSSTLSSACKPFAARPEVIGIGLCSLGSANQNGRH